MTLLDDGDGPDLFRLQDWAVHRTYHDIDEARPNQPVALGESRGLVSSLTSL